MKPLFLLVCFFLSFRLSAQNVMELMQKAIDHYQAGEYAQAIAPAEQAAVEVKSMMGEDNVLYRALLTIQASSYGRTFRYLRSEALWLELKRIGEKDKSDPAYATCLNNLATLYSEMGLYTMYKSSMP